MEKRHQYEEGGGREGVDEMGLSRGVLGRGHIEFVSIPKAMCHYQDAVYDCVHVFLLQLQDLTHAIRDG